MSTDFFEKIMARKPSGFFLSHVHRSGTSTCIYIVTVWSLAFLPGLSPSFFSSDDDGDDDDEEEEDYDDD